MGKYSRWLSGRSAITGATEWILDYSRREQIKLDGLDKNFTMGSVLIGHEFWLGKVTFSQELGVYYFNNYRINDDVYQRYGLNYHFNRMVHEIKASGEKINELHFEQLQRADKMVTLGELTASMAHDINNYSAIIMSRADYLLFESENQNFPEQITEDLKVINSQIEKISSITGNILRHSKKLSKSFVEVDLSKIINNVSEMMSPLLQKQKVKLICEVNAEDTIIQGDSPQLLFLWSL